MKVACVLACAHAVWKLCNNTYYTLRLKMLDVAALIHIDCRLLLSTGVILQACAYLCKGV